MSEVDSLRKQVKKYIDTADEKTVKMIYAMLEVEQSSDWWGDAQFISIVEERSASYNNDKIKAVPWEAAKKRILSASKTKAKR